MHDSLLRIITAHIALSEADVRACTTAFEPVLYPKNHLLEKAEKVPKYLYFVVSGYIRLFHYNQNGEELTTHINCPPGFITSYLLFIQQTQGR